jgi:hypothetical protein
MPALQPIDARVANAMLEIADFAAAVQDAVQMLRAEQTRHLRAERSEEAGAKLAEIEKSDREIQERYSKMIEALEIVVNAAGAPRR